ncbi:hypothetical protein [Sphingomonas yabuuchiae]|uniref:hypothetical protein n=1 Tax=Sphingomonas yabuuchiae TaxID=172044 RepID=UPI001FA110B2|nr:hypothetical protein [Candidatus Sphingomonas excrementigallinarum]
MSGRDMAWRSLGGLMTLGAVAATLTGPSESLLALFWFFVALGGVVLMLNGKHLVQAVRAERRGHPYTAEAIHAARIRRGRRS